MLEPVEQGTVETDSYVEFQERSLTFREDTPYEVWEAVIARLKSAQKSVQWWLGDALRFGERKYGEMYSQALEETDYTYGALRDAVYVASQIELSRRRDNLSFTHHREVAALEPDEQDALLSEAAPKPGETKPRLSTRQIREKARELKTLPPTKPNSIPEEEAADVEDPNAIKRIVRVKTVELVVEFNDGTRHAVTRNAILEDKNFGKCKSCGIGVERHQDQSKE